MTEARGDGAVPVPVSELDAADRLWLETETVDLADERITVVRLPDGSLGFDLATRRGIALIRYDSVSPVVRVIGLPWVIVSAPGKLAGTRYAAAGVACRSALRGFPWPESLSADFDERAFPTDLPDQPVSLPGIFIDPDVDELVTFAPYERGHPSGDPFLDFGKGEGLRHG